MQASEGQEKKYTLQNENEPPRKMTVVKNLMVAVI